jgi:hypothetical protein
VGTESGGWSDKQVGPFDEEEEDVIYPLGGGRISRPRPGFCFIVLESDRMGSGMKSDQSEAGSRPLY